MSTDAAHAPHRRISTPAVARPSRIAGARPSKAVPFGRLVNVELRKMVDTAAGRWLIISTGLLVAAVTVILAFDSPDRGFVDYLQATATPMAIIVPVIGILAVTSEWSVRSGLVTFVQEPRRGLVAWAKALAGMIVALVTVALAFALAAIATWAAGAFLDGTGTFTAPTLVMVGAGLMTLLSMAQGLAFGMLLRNSAAAIVTYFALPTVYSILGSLNWLPRAFFEWTDVNRAVAPLFTGTVTGEQWAQMGTSVATWVVLPFVVGIALVRRAEVK